MKLTTEQFNILHHTRFTASIPSVFCGDSPAMQELVTLGLMKSEGKRPWCPDEYFRITASGRAALTEALIEQERKYQAKREATT